MTAVGFYELLCWPTRRLVEHGIAAGAVTKLRFQETGHTRPLDPSWAPTFGSWGGVVGVETLAQLAGKPVERVRAYAKETGLRFANRGLHRTHGELAIALWCARGSSPQESCRKFGVWPGERRILCSAAQLLVDSTADGFASISKLPMHELETRFAALKLELKPPAAVLRAARWSIDDHFAELEPAVMQPQTAKETT